MFELIAVVIAVWLSSATALAFLLGPMLGRRPRVAPPIACQSAPTSHPERVRLTKL
jgi:hypothetical protein